MLEEYSCEVRLTHVGVPQVAPMAFSNLFNLTKNFLVEYIYKGEKKSYVVTAPFQTDGASIPEICWNFIGTPFEPRFLAAAILHDCQCNKGFELEEMTELFDAMLENAGVASSVRWKMKLAVHRYMQGQYQERGLL